MLQGTGSEVGKSLLVAGLGRACARRGLRVRPFKPQNMSNNAAVTPDGSEIGRAQAMQARACGVPFGVDMNPVLLKPQTDLGAQIIVHGRIWRNAGAGEYQALEGELLRKMLESFARLGSGADLILIEGAGSPAEINLPGADIANMGFADAADVPVILVGDIERGGVIASIVGTLALLAPAHGARLKGYIVNKFHGDPRLFDGGLRAIGERTGLECLGVVPYFTDARRLPAEDAVTVEAQQPAGNRPIRIAVPVFPRIANFDDFDPLIAEPDVAVDMVKAPTALPGDADLIVLPGSKATLADLAFMREVGWDVDIVAHWRRGGAVLGICGGYQMLGQRIGDADGIEGMPANAPGLGLLDVETELSAGKTLTEVAGTELASGEPVAGYEMHIGRTTGPDTRRPMLDLETGAEGAISADGRVRGCYVHGLFAKDPFRHAFLSRLKARRASGLAYEEELDQVLDGLADHLEAHLEVDRILEVAGVR